MKIRRDFIQRHEGYFILNPQLDKSVIVVSTQLYTQAENLLQRILRNHFDVCLTKLRKTSSLEHRILVLERGLDFFGQPGHHFIAANEVGYPVNWNEKPVELSRAEFLQAYEELAFFPSVETGDPSLENLLQQATLKFAAEQIFQYEPEPSVEFIEPIVADASTSSSAT